MNQSQPTTIGGRYEVGELLGRGGMAEVRKGTDTRLGRTVAIKRLRTDLASDATFQARFHREAQSSASLNHPSIVAVYDTGEEATPDAAAQPYIVMEYVAGRTLRDVLREGRKILPERALEITSDVLSALDYSHRAGIIHRDIKPGNVMLTPSGDVKVMDFGIARAMSDAASTMTHTSAVVGTAQYLSPEQARGETVDSRSDVYSAGCLLYELLTGRPPFVGDSPVSVASQHVLEQAEPPSTHDPSLPPEIDAIVMKALAKRLEDRYQSAAAMRSDIERYLSGRPLDAGTPADPTATAVAPAITDPDAALEDDDEKGPKPWLLVLLGLIVLALVAVGAFFLPALFDDPPERAQIPNVVNKTEREAAKLITAEGLTPHVEQEPSDDVDAGLVISQDPSGGQGAYTDPGSTITIVVSTGPPSVTMPDVVDASVQSAKSTLTGPQYEFTVRVEKEDSDRPAGTVLESNPSAGMELTKGKQTRVLLTVARGPRKVPSVVGKDESAAEDLIRDRGFKPVVVDDNESEEPSGTVVDQSPNAQQTLPQGSEVVIWVSRFEEESDPPEQTLPPCPTTTVVPDPLNPLDPDASTTEPIEPDPGDPATCTPPE